MSRHGSPYVVKHLAPMIGRPDSPKRVTVVYAAYSVEEALRFAREPTWVRGPAWVERRGAPASRRCQPDTLPPVENPARGGLVTERHERDNRPESRTADDSLKVKSPIIYPMETSRLVNYWGRRTVENPAENRSIARASRR